MKKLSKEKVVLNQIAKMMDDEVTFAMLLYGFKKIGKKHIELLNLDGEINVVVAGRRFGKTTYLASKVFRYALTHPKTTSLITAPSIDQAKIYFDLIVNALETNPFPQLINSEKHPFNMFLAEPPKVAPFPEIKLKNGSRIIVRSTAFKGKFIRGRKTNFILLTEAAFVDDEIFNSVILPMRLDTNAKIYLESTPYGRNYFFNLYQDAQSDTTGYYKYFHATVYDNPFLNREEIEKQKAKIPDYIWRQEYMGEFIDDSTAVFPWRVLKNVLEDYEPSGYRHNHEYVIGLDIAQVNDYNVFIVLDITNRPYTIAEIVRFNNTTYEYVVDVANRLSAKYNAIVYVDATTVGRPVAEKIKDAEPITLTSKSKIDIIDNLVLTMERKDIILPYKDDVLITELKYYRKEQLAHTIKMGSESKEVHDDTIIALALACWGVRGERAFSFSVDLF